MCRFESAQILRALRPRRLTPLTSKLPCCGEWRGVFTCPGESRKWLVSRPYWRIQGPLCQCRKRGVCG